MQEPLHPIRPPSHRAQPVLSLFGPLMIVFGVVLTVIGTFSYVSSLRTLKPPTYLWGVMVGLPMIGIGAGFLSLGQHGEILRDLAQISPAAWETINTPTEGTCQGAENRSHALGREPTTARNGASLSELETLLCGRCDASNPAGAKFCNQCGALLLNLNCPECGASITPSARFCNQCGTLVG